MYILYGAKTAVKSMVQEKWINLLCVMTVASSLLIIVLTGLFIYNIDYLAEKLHERFGMVIFLEDNLSKEEIESIINKVHQRQEVEGLRYISKDEALKELRERLKDDSYIFDGLEVNPLSPALEIKLKRSYINPQQVIKTSTELKTLKGINDVYSAEKIAEVISAFYKSVSNMGLIILATLASGIIFVVYSTVKILFYRRKDEIETLKLLGATRSFIRVPFLFEGGIIGFMGGLISIGISLVFYFAVTYRLSSVFPLLQTLLYPTEIIAIFPLVGIVLGVTGALIAVGRLRF